jgi:hypothetical protein
MKEIKFRAWDKNRGEMTLHDSLYEFQKWNRTAKELENFEVMQYTGLKDKNGKEIYSDDYLEDVAGGILCVFWGSGKYILQNISSGDIIDCNEKNTQNKTVIGNRYENPREHKAMATDL